MPGVHGSEHDTTVTTSGDHDRSLWKAGVLVEVAAGRELIAGSEDMEPRALGNFGGVDIDGLDGPVINSELRTRMVLQSVAGSNGDCPGTGSWRPGQIWPGTGVARGRDHHGPRGHCIGDGDGIRVSDLAERRVQRQVDDVHVVLDGPVDGIDCEIGRSLAPEDPQRVQIGLGSHTGADPKFVVVGGGIIGALVGVAISGHTRPGGGGRHMGPVSELLTVDGVVIRLWGVLSGVEVAGEVIPTFDA